MSEIEHVAKGRALSNLAACPFCGGRAFPQSPCLGNSRWQVLCDDCRAGGPHSNSETDTGEAEAIAVWNQRAPTPAAPDAVRELRDLSVRVRHLVLQSDGDDGLLRAAIGLRDDLLNRAKRDGEVKTVCAGNGAWFRFNEAIDAILATPSSDAGPYGNSTLEGCLYI